jgi:hypothetical protein
VQRIARCLQFDELFEAEYLLGLWCTDRHARNDLGFFSCGRITDDNLHEETVSLGLGEWVHAFALDGVLGGEH